ncbi:peptidase M13, partial [Stenotrophomonas maltophilia]
NELPTRMRYIFPLSARPEDNYLLGNSMGGYGTLRYAFTYPERFAAVAALSPVTDLIRFHVEQSAIMPDLELAFSPA